MRQPMSLTSGTRLGPYEVIGPLGAGGMGEVYRARDTKLGRDVALKILPDHFATDPDRLARFEREAKTLASLNHPHIAQIYGIEEARATDGRAEARPYMALVMELVEGEDLSQRISRGAIPIDDALLIARQIAEALEAAHEQGIIHRDLKPGNVKLRNDGTVKVLDFGLAKALDHGPVALASANLAHSPTITTPAMTQAGMILGTAAYMSPEQAKGRVVDRRTDLWAFGCVLFEMLTGKRAFAGDDVTDTLTAIFRDEPQWSALPADTPASVHRLLRRCLQKDRGTRHDSAAMARLEIDEPSTVDAHDVAASPAHAGAWRWLAAVAVIAALAVAGTVLTRQAPVPESQVIRFSLPLPPDLPFRTGGGAALVLAPDGRNVVYTSGEQGVIVRRRLDVDEFEVLKERGFSPFFSPDSKWIGFFADGKLKKTPLDGGLASTICNTELGRATWGDDGSIVFANADGLFRVSSSGGPPQAIEASERVRNLQGTAQPAFLPGARAILLRTWDGGKIRIQAFTLADGTFHDLAEGTNPLYATTGDVLFQHEGQLWSAPLDVKALTLGARPAPVLDGIRLQGGIALLDVASNGTIAYMDAEAVARSTIVWLDRKGQATLALSEPAGYGEPRLSPDGGRLAVEERTPAGTDVWVHDLNRRTKLRLTTSGTNVRPRWTPDGLRVSFQFEGDIYLRRADGSGDREPVLVRPGVQFPDAWTPDGTSLLFSEGSPRDLWAVAVGQEPVRVLPASSFSERSASVSPDGKWLVFASDESGRDEIYVQPYPGPGAKTTISNAGGKQPSWSRDGRELFYRQEDAMMVVPVGTDPTGAGAPRRLFDFPRASYGDDPNRVQYDVAADGRFLAVRADERAGGGDEIRVVVNWLTERKRSGFAK